MRSRTKQQNLLFLTGSVINCLDIPPNSKIEIKLRRNRLLTNLPRCQGALPDHVRFESSSCCFPRKLVSFDSRHVTSSSLIRNVFGLESMTMYFNVIADSPKY